MNATQRRKAKTEFKNQLTQFVAGLTSHVSTPDSQWTIKGFIDVFQNIYTISADTKIVSKILEIHLPFPEIIQFAGNYGYKIVLTDHQNYYPDITFIRLDDERIRFALDFKTTYRLPNSPDFCNGFTLGSHGEYFINRESMKNIQFPYNSYAGHFCLGIIYTRTVSDDLDETRIYKLDRLQSIVSVIRDFQFFICEKWEIASDRSGSGNTANIGSITRIADILSGNGMFKKLGEEWFDDYWMNYGKITTPDSDGKLKKIVRLKDFLVYRGKESHWVNERAKRSTRQREVK